MNINSRNNNYKEDRIRMKFKKKNKKYRTTKNLKKILKLMMLKILII